MKIFLKAVFNGAILSILAVQSGCNTFYSDDRPEVQYQRAYSAEQLEIPPDLSAPDQGAGFIVSGVAGGKIQRNTLLPTLDEVQYVRAGDLSWLELSASSEALWPLLRQFIQREGYLLKNDKPLEGFMETTWAEEQIAIPKGGVLGLFQETLELLSPTSELTSYLFRMERAGEAKTRLFVTHRLLNEERVNEVTNRSEDINEYTWAAQARDAEIEAQMLTRLMVFLGIDLQRAKGILSREDLAELESAVYLDKTSNDETALHISKTLALVWPEIEQALENMNFSIEDNNIDTGRFELGYSGAFLETGHKKESKGFFSQLFSGDDTHEYQVYLGDVPGGTRVTVRDINGDKLDLEEETAILNALRLQLI